MTLEPFTYRFVDTTDGESELFGIVDAANMVEALEKAASLMRQPHNVLRVEIERTNELGHLSLAAQLVASKATPASSVERTSTDAVEVIRIVPAEKVRKAEG
ncbi:hypothetical protein [Bradyrhizobium sp. Ai1a-2]|uniref:hypothetical protein n=1 Tax=Bradyrhizobium sp. Ai1a-2 TaxID=196490 RepID=UPI00040E0EE9|nr:hypothetical protein [Bradyrhizobium sp. Ai1a-2]